MTLASLYGPARTSTVLSFAFATESWSSVNVGLGFSKRFFGQMVCIWFFVVGPWAILVYLKIFALGIGILQQRLGILFAFISIFLM